MTRWNCVLNAADGWFSVLCRTEAEAGMEERDFYDERQEMKKST